MTINSKDAVAGVVFILIGLGFGLNAWLNLPLGTSLRMGPGYFPLVLSGILVLLGVVTLFHAMQIPDEPWGSVAWRGMLFILIGPIAFGATIQGLGLVPALAMIAFITSFASHRVSVPLAIVLTAGLTLFCVAVFHWGLGMPVPLFGPWVRSLGLGV
jgi:Tripartite tricarboxylate transporter TctB family